MSDILKESLLQAIKNDDTKAFSALMETAQCGAYRLGRFPVLSLLYLYGARKLLSVYEDKFLKVTSHEALREPAEISKKFSAKAGKCLRLYLSEVVSPLEMLLILDQTKRLKRVYSQTKPSAAVKGRLQTIYSMKYALGIKFEGNEIILDRRPFTSREKKRIATVCACSILAVVVAVGAPVTAVSLMPSLAEGEVTKLSHIDFQSQNEYTLKRDIVLPDDYSVEKVNCKINGGGKKLIFGKGATLGTLNGKLSNLTVESAGDILFNSVSTGAVIENVTVNVKADVTTKDGTALVALTNLGTIAGVTVNVSGKINASAASTEANQILPFGGIVFENAAGVIANCTVNYTNFELIGAVGANAEFGGVAGVNNAYVQNCTVTGEIIADTFDLAGVCALNYGLLFGNVNEANLSQTSLNASWSPVVGGIALHNIYTIDTCMNTGSISIAGNAACAGGISAYNEVAYEYQFVYFGVVDSCISTGEINVTATDEEATFVGGIVGLVREMGFKNQDGSDAYFGGGITNCYFTGECVKEIPYFGNIAGVCGANIYKSNSYVIGNTEYHNFENNYYAENAYRAFGAAVDEDKLIPIEEEDKRATSAAREEIKNSAGYQAILKELKK